MQLVIDNELRRFVPIKSFRETFDLPDTFGVAMFEPKDFRGLGKIESAGPELNFVRRAVLDAIPTEMPLHAWLAYLPNLSRLLENKLHEVNADIGLKSVEIDYAVSGFEDVLQSLLYAMIRARSAGEPTPQFMSIYTTWLNDSVKISSKVHSYIHKGATWAVQVVNNAYGRVGLIVWMDDDTHYVRDVRLGCPAEGFMVTLLSDVAARIIVATRSTPPASE